MEDTILVRPLRFAPLLLVFIVALLIGCSSSSGLPAAPGEYEIKPKSLVYDGQDYQFYWTDKDGQLRRATADNVKMVEDQRTFLEMQGKEPIVHLATEEPVTVVGEDRQGGFSSFWFPFFLGQTMGSMGRDRTVVINQPVPGTSGTPSNKPTYHYPPTDSFGRDDSLHGSVTSPKPTTPNYGKIPPAPYSVSGQSGGTGGGTATAGKSVQASGQTGSTGTGTAASSKGGFAKGQSSYQAKTGGTRSITGSSSGTSSSRQTAPSSGVSGGKSGGSKPSSGVRGGGGGRRR